jgi:DNA-binding NarL/FixJ family response regulator
VTNFNSVALDQQWPRGLTSRESEVVVLVGTGISNKEIAQQLGLSIGTVKQHVRSIFRKTGARHRYDLIAQIATQAALRNL